MREAVVKEVDRLTDSVRHLHRIQDRHWEGVLLRYCYCAKITHLTRLVEPGSMTKGVQLFEDRMSMQVARLAGEERGDPEVIKQAWEVAKQPVRTIGIGIGDVKLTAPSAFAASMGAVARLADQINEPHSKLTLDIIQSDPFSQEVFSTLSQSTPDTPTPKCPALVDVKKTPSQKTLSEVQYEAKTKAIIESFKPRFNARQPGDAAVRKLQIKKYLYFQSQAQFGSGKEYDSIPKNKQDHLDSFTYTQNLRLRLGIETQYSIITDKGTSHANARHNALRRILIAMYKVLGEDPLEEPAGLLKAAVNILRRPADIAILPAVHNTEKMLALDVSVISPVSACFIKGARNSFDPEPLQAAKSREKEKVETDQLWVSAEAVDPCYEKIPVVFEATGAWGKSAQDWFRMVMVSFKVKFPEGIHRSSPLGMEHHWGATSFQAYYHQKIALSLAKFRGAAFWHSRVNPFGP